MTSFWDILQQDWPRIGIAAVAMISGIRQFFWPIKVREGAIKNHQQKLEQRLSRGSDAYFEELRALKTYDPSRPEYPTSRYWGLFGIILGVVMLTAILFN